MYPGFVWVLLCDKPPFLTQFPVYVQTHPNPQEGKKNEKEQAVINDMKRDAYRKYFALL
jgi:hypothetical protein